jgi:hypothetical protein
VDNRKKEYLDKIIMYLFEDTDFEYIPEDKECSIVVDTHFTTDCFDDWRCYDHTLIQDFCVEDYGLTVDEVKYVWREYNKMIYHKVGEIVVNNTNRNINESINDDNYSQKVVSVMKPPYIEDLRMFKIPTDKWLDVFSLLFNKDKNFLEIDRNINSEATIISINIPTNPPKLPLYVEWDNGPWTLRDYDEMGNMIYYEESDGYWEKYEYNDKSVPTYYENSDGYSDDYIENNLNESISDKENFIIDKIVNFMLEDTNYKIKTIKDEPVVRIVYPFYGEEQVYTEDRNGIDYHLIFMDGWSVGTDDYTYMNDQFGITNKNIIQEIFNKYNLVLFTQLKKEIEGKMGRSNINESVEINNRFLDKVVESLIGGTSIVPKLQMIVYPSINFYSSRMSLLLPSKVFYNEFSDYCEKHYGTTSDEFDIIWKKYSKIMFDKFDKGENILKESDDRRKNYLDKVLEFILSDTHITSYTSWEWVNIEVPFTDLQYSRMRHFDLFNFVNYCRDNYGLTKDESYSVWEDYINEINQTLINEWGVQDPIYH